jgi:glycosyltransferase involved in cell wall biosynthesis
MTGLGLQGRALHKFLRPAKTMIVDISECNGYEQHHDWYPGSILAKGLPTSMDIKSFVKDLDLVLVTETAYNDQLYAYARSRGVVTINIQNYEFFTWMTNPDIPLPDAFVSPSMWHYDDVQAFCNRRRLAHTYLHNPVDRIEFPFRSINNINIFVHSAGRSATHDRSGTYTVIDASRYIESDARLVVHFQGEQGLPHQRTATIADYMRYAAKHGNADKLDFLVKDLPHSADIYALGDVYVQPRRYGGNNLCMGEALSSGLPVIMTDISPNKQFLPAHWLVPARKINRLAGYTAIDVYEADAKLLATKIDWFSALSKKDIYTENHLADKLADKISWKTMLPRYQEFIHGFDKPGEDLHESAAAAIAAAQASSGEETRPMNQMSLGLGGPALGPC